LRQTFRYSRQRDFTWILLNDDKGMQRTSILSLFSVLTSTLAFCFATFCSTVVHAQAPYFEWARTFGFGRAVGIAPLANGEIIVAGVINSYWLQKLDARGNLIWGVSLNPRATLYALAVDGSGNSYVTGRTDVEDAFPGQEVDGLFVAKYSPQGVLLWVAGSTRKSGTNSTATGYSIDVARSGEIYVGGEWIGEMNFGDNASPGGKGPLVCKLSIEGRFEWVRFISATGLFPGSAEAVRADREGNIFVGGMVGGRADFGGETVTADETVLRPDGGFTIKGDAFLAKYSALGALRWAKLVDAQNDGHGHVRALALDSLGSCYFAGMNVQEPWPGARAQLSSYGGKMGPSGELLWLRNPFQSVFSDVALGPDERPVFTGSFSGTQIVLDGVTLIKSENGSDGLVTAASANGVFEWAIAVPGADPYRLSVAADGSALLSGGFQRSVQLDSFALSFPDYNGFLARLTPEPPLRVSVTRSKTVVSWPARASGYILETSESVAPGSWTRVATTPAVNGAVQSVEAEMTGNAGFYRLRKVP
jgi:hypothetical protein